MSKTKFNPSNIPSVMRQYNVWCGVINKQPVRATRIPMTEDAQVTRGDFAMSNRPETLATFTTICDYTAAAPHVKAAGFALDKSHGIVVIDLDDYKKRADEALARGKIDAAGHAAAIVNGARVRNDILTRFLGAYIERSVSGNGFHIAFHARMPESVGRYEIRGTGEVFNDKQFIYMTGWAIPESQPELVDMQDQFNAFVSDYHEDEMMRAHAVAEFTDGEIAEATTSLFRSTTLTDEEVVSFLCRTDERKGTYERTGDGFSDDDHSAGSFILIGEIDKITGDSAQAERVFFNSPRMRKAELFQERKWQRIFHKQLSKARRSNTLNYQRDPLLYYMQTHYAISTGERLAGEWCIAYDREQTAALEQQRADFMATAAAYVERQALKSEYIKRTEAPPAIPLPTTSVLSERDDEFRKAFSIDKPRHMQAFDYICGDVPDIFKKPCLPPYRLGGLVQAVMCGMYEPDMEIATISTVTQITPYLARKYKTFDGHAPTMMSLLVAGSSRGKSQGINSFNKLVYNAGKSVRGFTPREIPIEIASKQGMHLVLQGAPASCVVDHDAKAQIKAIMSVEQTAVEAGLTGFLQKAFDASSQGADVLYPTSSATGAAQRKDRAIYAPRLSCMYATTDENAEQHLSASAVANGLMSRILLVWVGGESNENQEFETTMWKLTNEPITRERMWSSLIRPQPGEELAVSSSLHDVMVHLIKESLEYDESMELYTNYMNGPLDPKDAQPDPANPVPEPTPSMVAISPDAREWLKVVSKRMNGFKREQQTNAGKWPTWYLALNRVTMQGVRLATVSAILNNPNNPTVNITELQYWIAYATRAMCSLLVRFDTNKLGATLSAAETTAMHGLEVLLSRTTTGFVKHNSWDQWLRDHAPFRSLQGTQQTTVIKDVIQRLYEANKIDCIQLPTTRAGGRPPKAYTIVVGEGD